MEYVRLKEGGRGLIKNGEKGGVEKRWIVQYTMIHYPTLHHFHCLKIKLRDPDITGL